MPDPTRYAAEALKRVDGLVDGFLYYDRKEDETLPVGAIEKAITLGLLTVDQIVEMFDTRVRAALAEAQDAAATPPARNRIGSVTVLRARAYPIDPDDNVSDPNTVVGLFEPGLYPVYREQETGLIYWEIEGAVPSVWRQPKLEPLGDGMFELKPGYHGATGAPLVTVRSKKFTAAEFDDFLTEPGCNSGPEQRLDFQLDLDKL